MKPFRFHLYAIAYLSLVLSLMTLLVGIQPSLAAGNKEDKVVYAPNDDLLLMMSYSQAKRRIESMENRRLPIPPGYTDYTYNATILKDIKISSDKITFTKNYPEVVWSYTSYLKSMDPNVVKSTYGTYNVLLGGGEPVHYETGKHRYTHEGNASFWDALRKDEAVSLVNAFYVLKRYAEGYTPEDPAFSAAFANGAKRYREMPVKPAMPEDVQRCRVVAEDAFNNKDFKKALDYYRKGLAIEPLWPQGQFNAAMLAGELHSYKWAALYMKRYLELVPDAKNANAAREKMYLWEEKAKEEQQKLTGAGE